MEPVGGTDIWGDGENINSTQTNTRPKEYAAPEASGWYEANPTPQIMDYFLEEKDKDGKITKRKTNDAYQQVKMDKIILLQNDKTASASEALIGALKQQLPKKVTTVGTTTYGKGTEQEQVSFKDGTSMKYTVGKWLTPNGSNINEKGFKPDVSVEDEKANEVSYESFKKKDVIAPDTTATNAEALQVFQLIWAMMQTVQICIQSYKFRGFEAVQSDNGIVASGSCDYTTWKKLLKKVGMALQDQQRTTNPQYRKAVEMIESQQYYDFFKGGCMKDSFELVSDYKPSGDQPQAIQALWKGWKQIRNTRF